MNRNELETIYYGEGPALPTWATDCPVRFDTWLAFAQDHALSPPQVDLILTINEEHGVQRVLDHLKRPEFNDFAQKTQTIASGNFVIAKLKLDELVRAILPMTNLYGAIKQAQSMSLLDLEAAVLQGGVGADQVSVSGFDELPERSSERNEQFSWFLRVLARVAMDSGYESKHVVKMLLDTVAEPQMTQPPPAAGQWQASLRRCRCP